MLFLADDHHAATAHGSTAEHAAHAHAAPAPMDHVVDKVLAKTEAGLPWFTLHMGTLVLAALLTLLVLWIVSRRMATGPESEGHRRYLAKGRLAQLFETIIVYLRDEMIRPILGDAATKRFLPFLLTVFFFVWFCNMLGLIPLLDLQHLLGGVLWGDYHFALIGGTATGNIAVTAALATIAFVVIQIHGFRELGVIGWIDHLRCGAPWYAAPLIMLVELGGMLIKPAALAIRLFANMLAGHVLMGTVILFGFMALNAGLGWAAGGVIGLVSGGAAVALYFLEIFVATLQAFVFMFLVTVFMSLMNHHDEEHEEHGEHGAHGHGEAASH